MVNSTGQNYSRSPAGGRGGSSSKPPQGVMCDLFDSLPGENQLSAFKRCRPKIEWENKRWTSLPSLSKHVITGRWRGSSAVTLSSAETIWYKRQIDGESFYHLTLLQNKWSRLWQVMHQRSGFPRVIALDKYSADRWEFPSYYVIIRWWVHCKNTIHFKDTLAEGHHLIFLNISHSVSRNIYIFLN